MKTSRQTKPRRRQAFGEWRHWGLVLISPWLVGFVLFKLITILSSLVLFFGNAVYIFLLRQNFRSIPVDLEEAAMLDAAGPLRRLFSIILPQSWPVVVTVSLLHFFYMWNETRIASLYLTTTDLSLMPISFAVQTYQSRLPIQNVIETGTVVILIIPVMILFLSQRMFTQGVIVTGAEK